MPTSITVTIPMDRIYTLFPIVDAHIKEIDVINVFGDEKHLINEFYSICETTSKGGRMKALR